MSETKEAETGFWSTCIRLFVITLLSFVLVRTIGKWLMSGSIAEFTSWVHAHWVAELIFCVMAAVLVSLMEGYRVWLGPRYSHRESDYER